MLLEQLGSLDDKLEEGNDSILLIMSFGQYHNNNMKKKQNVAEKYNKKN